MCVVGVWARVGVRVRMRMRMRMRVRVRVRVRVRSYKHVGAIVWVTALSPVPPPSLGILSVVAISLCCCVLQGAGPHSRRLQAG